MRKARANIYVYSGTVFSGLIFEGQMISTPRTARYVLRNQAKTVEDAESTSDHIRIQLRIVTGSRYCDGQPDELPGHHC